jgi:hypothetical protein
MKKKIYLILLLFLSSCGYNPVYINKETNFSIGTIIIKDKTQVSYNIKNNLEKYLNLSNKPVKINIELQTQKIIKIKSKDSKGNAKTFELTINVQLLINKDEKKIEKEFIKSFSYENKTNKFDLKSYENDIMNNLSDKIILEITEYLFEITQ